MSKLKIIGLSGTNGAGKDSVAELLVEKHGYQHISVSDLLRHEARKRNLPLERHHLAAISTEWRKQFGHGVLIDRAHEHFSGNSDDVAGLVVASLRNPGEAERIHELGGKVVWVDAQPRIRYERITRRARSAEDAKSFEQFMSEELREMEHSGDDAGLHMEGVKEKADILLDNSDDDIEEFKSRAETALRAAKLI